MTKHQKVFFVIPILVLRPYSYEIISLGSQFSHLPQKFFL